jgi:hypothetical protein
MSEDDLLASVLEMGQLLHVRTAHFRPAQVRPGKWITPVAGDGKGWLDLFIAGRRGILFRELKSAIGRVTPEQRTWIAALTAAGQNVGVWRPADLASGRIQREIRAVA